MACATVMGWPGTAGTSLVSSLDQLKSFSKTRATSLMTALVLSWLMVTMLLTRSLPYFSVT